MTESLCECFYDSHSVSYADTTAKSLIPLTLYLPGPPTNYSHDPANTEIHVPALLISGVFGVVENGPAYVTCRVLKIDLAAD